MKPLRKQGCGGPYEGLGEMVSVGAKGETKVLWTTRWFAAQRQVHLHAKGVYVVRVGAGGHLKLSDRHDGLLFYKKGKLLKRWSTKALIRDPSKVRFRDALPKGCVSSYRFLRTIEGFKGSSFQVQTVDGDTLTFDIRTGKLTRRTPLTK